MTATEKLRSFSLVGIATVLLAICGCQGLQQGSTTTTPPPPPPATLQTAVNHIIFMAQENRSFDTFFGQLPAYWAANGYPQNQSQFDGMPATASNPGFNGGAAISAYHLSTVCIENLSPSWNESHVDWNVSDPSSTTATMDGFVYNAANYAINENAAGAQPAFTDTVGARAMGYYDGDDLNYYYFMASNFATSDRWFAPALDRTQVNRMYLFAATSQGYAYPPGSNPPADNHPLTDLTIFDALNKAGISWKVYYSDDTCATAVADKQAPRAAIIRDAAASSGACTYLTQFAGYAPPNALPSNVVPVDPDYFNDVQNGTLPSVAFIEGGYESGRDEHPSSGTNMQTGANYESSLINALMTSSVSWKDSVFILTYDEPGGLYDHVPPQPAVNPDGIAPIDLFPTDICSPTHDPNAPNCDFNYTGFRVPLLVVSPFTKKNYVSHTVADYTAILKLIETRFNIPSLTQRDAAQMDMTEFFDFQNVPWATPPTPPAQNTGGTCNATVLGDAAQGQAK
jgi:phospholipase C